MHSSVLRPQVVCSSTCSGPPRLGAQSWMTDAGSEEKSSMHEVLLRNGVLQAPDQVWVRSQSSFRFLASTVEDPRHLRLAAMPREEFTAWSSPERRLHPLSLALQAHAKGCGCRLTFPMSPTSTLVRAREEQGIGCQGHTEPLNRSAAPRK